MFTDIVGYTALMRSWQVLAVPAMLLNVASIFSKKAYKNLKNINRMSTQNIIDNAIKTNALRL